MDERKIYQRCSRCGQMNRLPVGRVSDGPRCGHCQTELRPEKPQELDERTLGTVLQGDLPVIVDFWAPWCGPCRVMAPALEKLASRYVGRLQVAKVNTDEVPQLARQHGISGIPTLIVFSAGHEVDRVVGALAPPQLYELGERYAV
ncbi:MAG: thioredoxin TrxC [Deltaproteobacteria bacterium]|nr:thioredoxin TrxC [Deltaproteobacteria bacterium]